MWLVSTNWEIIKIVNVNEDSAPHLIKKCFSLSVKIFFCLLQVRLLTRNLKKKKTFIYLTFIFYTLQDLIFTT